MFPGADVVRLWPWQLLHAKHPEYQAMPTDLPAPPTSDAQTPARSWFRLAVVAACIAALSPALVLIALALRLESPGPILLRDRRARRPAGALRFRTVMALKGGGAARTVTGSALVRSGLDQVPSVISRRLGAAPRYAGSAR